MSLQAGNLRLRQVSADTYTTRSYAYEGGQRPGRHGARNQPTFCGSLGGAVVGVVLLLGATVLLWMNEGDAVRAQQSIQEASLALADETGGLTHVTGMLTAGEGPLADDEFGIALSALKLERTAEVYQWREHTDTSKRRVPDGRGGEMTETTKTKRYDTEWEAREIASSRFQHAQGHRNPSWSEATQLASERANGLPFGAQAWRAPSVRLDGLRLGAALLSKAERMAPLEASEMHGAKSRLEGSGARLVGGHVYSAAECASSPSVGCVRLSWRRAPLAEVSVVAKKSARGELVEWPSSAGQGYEVALLEFGERGGQAMLAAAAAQASAWTWIKRGGGVLLTWLGWALLFGPAQYLATWIPLLSGLVGCLLSAVALGVALAHSLTVIALAWVAQRPALAISLLAVGGGALYMVVSSLRARRAAAASSSTPMSGSAGGRHVPVD